MGIHDVRHVAWEKKVTAACLYIRIDRTRTKFSSVSHGHVSVPVYQHRRCIEVSPQGVYIGRTIIEKS